MHFERMTTYLRALGHDLKIMNKRWHISKAKGLETLTNFTEKKLTFGKSI